MYRSLCAHACVLTTVLAERRVFRSPTGDLSDPRDTAHWRDQWLPPTAFARPTVAVVDLAGMLFTPASLLELVVPLGQRIRGGLYGALRIVVATPDAATQEILGLLARRFEIPFFIADSSDPEDVASARPAGDLTKSDEETLAYLVHEGWGSTVSNLAKSVGIEPTAANNRLVNLERKGYVYRVHRPRRYGDLYVDPRVPLEGAKDGYEAQPMLGALASHGITTDPYETSDLHLHGKDAKRAREILRRRGKAD